MSDPIPLILYGPTPTQPANPNLDFQGTVIQGTPGEQGEQGIQGLQGEKGDAGSGFTNRGEWMTGTYASGDYVYAGSSADADDPSIWILIGNTSYDSTVEPRLDTDHWHELTGFQGPTGDTGPQGEQGEDGISAYQVAVNNGFVGTESEWLASLQGADGAAGTNGIDGTDGADGANGLSAYQVAVNNGFVGTESEWLASLVGADGQDAVYATYEEGLAGTSTTVASSPARVKEYAQQYGVNNTYLNAATDLNTVVVGSQFVWSSTTSNIPVSESYGRGYCIPSGPDDITQIGFENGTNKGFIRYKTGGTWGSWDVIQAAASLEDLPTQVQEAGAASVAQNRVWASPNGASGAPVFRSLAVADLPATIQNTLNISNRNFVINGAFDFWQRSTSSAASAYSSVDRFVNNGSQSDVTLSRQSHTPGELGSGVYTPRHFARMVVPTISGTSRFSTLQHRLEGLWFFQGRTVTISFWAKASTSGLKAVVEFTKTFSPGSAGSTSVLNNIGTTTLILSTTWTRYSVTVAIPSDASDATYADNSSLNFNIWLSSGSDYNARNNSLGFQTGTFDISSIQLEYGSVATPFDVRPAEIELALCQRYFEKSYPIDSPPGTTSTSGALQYQIGGLSSSSRVVTQAVVFKVTKRTTPTVTAYSYSTGASGVIRDAAAGADVTASVGAIGDSGVKIEATLAAATLVNMITHWTADSEI